MLGSNNEGNKYNDLMTNYKIITMPDTRSQASEWMFILVTISWKFKLDIILDRHLQADLL